MGINVGVDLGHRSSHVAIVDGVGGLKASMRVTHDEEGLKAFNAAVRVAFRGPRRTVRVAVEDAGCLFAQRLRLAGYDVQIVPPLAAAKFRDGWALSRAKSDRGDARMLADLLRTGSVRLPPPVTDSELAQQIRVLARDHAALGVRRRHLIRAVRHTLDAYYPAASDAFTQLWRPSARTVLRMAPDPAAARALNAAELKAVLAGQRLSNAEIYANTVVAKLQRTDLRLTPGMEQFMSRRMVAALDELESALSAADTVKTQMLELFAAHPDFPIYASFPALHGVLGAYFLGEIGDQRSRFTSARGLRAYAGTAPVTRASGATVTVSRRMVCNRRLQHYSTMWVLPMITTLPQARRRYDERRDRGDRHPAAARNVANHYFGALHACLRDGRVFDASRD